MDQEVNLPQVEHLLQRLTDALLAYKTRKEENEIVLEIIAVDESLYEKYRLLPVSQLIKKNVRDSSTAKTLNACLKELEDIGKTLMRPKEQMPAAWSEVKNGKRQFKVISKVMGGVNLLLKLGYAEQTGAGYRFPGFPDSVEQKKPNIANFTASVICLQAELKAYIEGQQPSAKRVNDCIQQNGDADNIFEEESTLVEPQQAFEVSLQPTTLDTGSITVTIQEEKEEQKAKMSPKSLNKYETDISKQNVAKKRDFANQLASVLERQHQGQSSRKTVNPGKKGEGYTSEEQNLPEPYAELRTSTSRNGKDNNEKRGTVEKHPIPNLLKDLRAFQFPGVIQPPTKIDQQLPSNSRNPSKQNMSKEGIALPIDMGGLQPEASDLQAPCEDVRVSKDNRRSFQKIESRKESKGATREVPKLETSSADKSKLGSADKQGNHVRIQMLLKTIQFIETRIDRMIINDPDFLENPEYIAFQERLDKSKQELSDLQASTEHVITPANPKQDESKDGSDDGCKPQMQDNEMPTQMPLEDLQKVPKAIVDEATCDPVDIPKISTGIIAGGLEIKSGIYSKELPVGQDDNLNISLNPPQLLYERKEKGTKTVVHQVLSPNANQIMNDAFDIPTVKEGKAIKLGEAPTENDADTWKCAQCGLLNQVSSLDCVACSTPRIKADSQPAIGLTETYIEPQHHYYEIDEAKLNYPINIPHIAREMKKKSPLRQASVPDRPAQHKVPPKPPPKSRPGNIKKSLTSILELQKRPLPAAPSQNESRGVSRVEPAEVPQINPPEQSRAPERFIRLNHPPKYEQKIKRRPPPPQRWTCPVCEVANKPSDMSCKKCATNKDSKISLLDRKIQFIMKQGNFRQEAVDETLKRCNGDICRSVSQLTKQIVQMFEETIWEPAHQDIPKGKVDDDVARMLQDKSLSVERRVRMIMVEGDLEDATRAENAVSLIDDAEVFIEGLHVQDVIEAVKIGDGDRGSSRGRLVQECKICYEMRPLNQIQGLIFCPCPVCTECFIEGYASYVRNKPPFEWRCLVCSKPDPEDEGAMNEHFGFLDIKVQQLVKETPNGASIYELFSKRLAHWKLKDEENFVWCKTPECQNGFIHEDANKIRCPFCQKSMCWKCDETWIEEHDNRTCTEYQEWKNQQEIKGVRDELKKKGEYLECPNPKCKELFEVTKGGCMHFKCSQCHYEFCNVCRVEFVRDKKRGLSCNHPRNCLAYIRDFQVQHIQQLLKKHKVDIEQLRRDAPKKGKCDVREVKNQGEPETLCGEKILSKGLCKKHYKEWLATLVKENRLDPVEIMDKNVLKALLDKEKMEYETQGKMKDEEYTEYLRRVVADKLPLRY